MKALKKVLVSMLLFVGGFSLFSCGHEHSVTGDYQFDETNHWQECFDCDEKFNVEAHKFGEWVLNDNKTIESRECECGYIETRDYVDPHPTCTFTNYVSNEDATCTHNGTETAKCDGCNKTDTREVENSKLPHTFTNYESNGDATCTADGTETAKCDHCTNTDTRVEEGSKLPHTFKDYVPNNNATCISNATETAKCEYCDEKDTREIENSKVDHNYGELVAEDAANCTKEGFKAHYQCSACETYFTEEKVETTYEALKIPFLHNYGDWTVTKYPTFTETGSRTRSCECGHVDTQEIPALVEVTEVTIENENIKVVEGATVKLSGLINPVDADSYELEWISSNANVVEISLVEGEYIAITKAPSNNKASEEITITLKVTNMLNDDEYSNVTDTFTITVVARTMLAEYTFENGFANTGTDQDVKSYGIANADGSIVDMLSYIGDVNSDENKDLKVAHHSSRNSFRLDGIDINNGDFTLTVKMYQNATIGKTDGSYQHYLFGTSTIENAVMSVKAPMFNVRLAKVEDGVMSLRVRMAGKDYDTLAYIPSKTWIEYRIVKQGTTVTISTHFTYTGDNENVKPSSITVELASVDELIIDPTYRLGFGWNNAASRPGNDSYVDDIRIFNFAANICENDDHSFTNYVSNNDATCEENATETAKCDNCDMKDTQEVADSALGHSYTNYVSNNDATCTSNATETAKCDNCDETDTREIENTMIEHNYGTLVEAVESTCLVKGVKAHYQCSGCEKYFDEEKVETTLEALTMPLAHVYGDLVAKVEANCTQTGMQAHYQCSACQAYFDEEKVEKQLEELIIPITHEYGDWNVTKPATFEETGLQVRSCECGESEEEEIPTLVAVNEVIIENSDKTVPEGASVELSGLIYPVDAKNFKIEWISSNEELVEITSVAGVYTAVVKELTGTESVQVTITFKVTNEANGSEYNNVTDTFVLTVVDKDPIAEFTFENGLTNTGTNSAIQGGMISNADGTRGQTLDIDASTYIHTSHVVSSTTHQIGSSAIFASHSSARPSFGVKGIDTGTGDFTISAKHYMPSDFIKSNYSKNNQWYVMGMNTEENSGNNFSIRIGKDSEGAGYFRTIVTLNGEKVNLFEKDVAGYYSGRKWVEYRIVKEGTKVTVTIIPSSEETHVKCIEYSVVFTLDSPEDFTLTTAHILGFGNNYGSSRPGNDSYFDDIKVWNYAVDFE